jgi:hypothetical protein
MHLEQLLRLRVFPIGEHLRASSCLSERPRNFGYQGGRLGLRSQETSRLRGVIDSQSMKSSWLLERCTSHPHPDPLL